MAKNNNNKAKDVSKETYQENLKKFAFYCKACDRPLTQFAASVRLPDGSPDDMCTGCKKATIEANYTRWTDYQFAFAKDSTDILQDD